MSLRILSVAIKYEHDVVVARQRARQLARLMGFEAQDQVRVATAVSEIARNAFRYTGGGTVEFGLEGRTPPQLLEIVVTDRGAGIAHLAQVLGGQYRSSTGMGVGMTGARRLMDQFDVQTRPGAGTRVVLRKILPRAAAFLPPARVAAIADELAREAPQSPIEEVQRQNQELLQALDELRRRQEELTRLNRELEDTNRGVVALYAELDEKADHLRRADELKSRFLSNMSHEFRTPLNSITALSYILLDRVDGDLTPEQEKQVTFIRTAAHDLSELVNDLLDLAKVEAGKIVVRPIEFEVANLFGALRGMLRPLLVNESVNLVFEAAENLPPLYTDEAKVSQILRNFISNALKFTERGEVRVTATLDTERDSVVFAVADTGIGIAPEDQELIFEEFTQLESPLQKRVKGTGLGLPLTRKLAELLGGRVTVKSQPGVGSKFSAVIPRVCPAATYVEAEVAAGGFAEPAPVAPVLVVDDDATALTIYDKYLKGSGFDMIPARSLREARQAMSAVRPRAILLDILLEGEDAWKFLADLKAGDDTRDIPVVVLSTTDDPGKGLALGADVYAVKPVEREWLLDTLRRLAGVARVPHALVIDDEDASRYVLKRLLSEIGCTVTEAPNGADGLRLARHARPDAIFLDLGMPGMSGEEVLAELKADPALADIPVIVVTAKALGDRARDELAAKVVAVLSKDHSSREAALASLQEAWAKAGLAAA
jgi:signal transduction histidine kinase/CheY-like chemotaxis protein